MPDILRLLRQEEHDVASFEETTERLRLLAERHSE
jgi:hypothetical protein